MRPAAPHAEAIHVLARREQQTRRADGAWSVCSASACISANSSQWTSSSREAIHIDLERSSSSA
jgi:hypothetical protein